ncbi:LOW QUALITY PROTEIN: CDK5 regulatory subunit-associated protein 2 [Neosynchiropus ocellatus]
MDSVVGDDVTLPVDMNGSCGLPDSIGADYSADSMTASSFPGKMSPSKAMTMKDYENQITALKKENFNLKLRIYFMEERMQQKCDDSTEDIFKTNIELKVELESMKRDLAEKQELLVSASKALESLATRDSGEPNRIRELAQREMDVLREAFNKRIMDLEQGLCAANDEVEKMAAIAEQEKLKNINMEKELQVLRLPGSIHQNPVVDLQLALQEKDNYIEQLKITLKNQDALIQERNSGELRMGAPPSAAVRQLSELIAKKDQELEPSVLSDLVQILHCISKQRLSAPAGSRIPVLKEFAAGQLNLWNKRRSKEAELKPLHDLSEEFDDQYASVEVEKQSDFHHLEMVNKLLNDELNQTKHTLEDLTRTLEETQKSLSGRLEEKENELNSEKKNALKRDKTIQGLTQVLREKEKEMAELCHEIEDRDDALTKARESAHKAQLQKYQGVEEHQNLLMVTQTELAQLQGDHHSKVLEAQKLQRALDRREQELADMQQAKEQLEEELEDLQQQKKKGDKAVNDLNNQLKKLSGEIGERESSLEFHYQELLDQTKRKVQAHEVTIQRLTSTLAEKEQQLQEYINMVQDFEQNKSPKGNDNIISKLRQRLKEKEKALEEALDEKFAAVEEKDNEIHQLQLSLREKERDLERLNNILSHNEETINSFDSMIKEKDVELQHLANTMKNLQRAKHDLEENLNRALREKDSIISQLQQSLNGKTKDLEELSESMLSQTQSQTRDLAEQMGQRLKVTEAMLTEAVKARERLVSDNESAVEDLLATISSKDQLLKESAEHYNRMLSERSLEIQDLRRQLSERQQQLFAAERQNSTVAQEGCLETAQLKAMLNEKDSLINKLLERGQERDQYLAEMKQRGESEKVLELRQTIQVMQERLEHSEAELSRWISGDHVQHVSLQNKTVVLLKTELEQKTEELNKALKRESELKMSLAELQSQLSELEGQSQAHTAFVESLTDTLKTKDEIINDLYQRLGQRGDDIEEQNQATDCSKEGSLSSLPQRESTMIGGDIQAQALPNLIALQQEHAALNKALRAEQHLYSNLVRAVKEQDSVQRLHTLQLELTAVQLLRQQLEESIKTNEELRDDLEKEINRVKLREGPDLKELERVRHQLEDAHRWNASLQARLGAIQNRGGGVGGANDTGNSMSFFGDQTSYMSICLGEDLDDSLSSLSSQELKKLQREEPLVTRTSQHDDNLEQIVTDKVLTNESVDSGLSQSREHAHSGSSAWLTGESRHRTDLLELDSLMADFGFTSLSQFRAELLKLRSQNTALQGLLKEQNSSERKEKESADVSANSSDGRPEWRQSTEMMQEECQSLAAVRGQKTSKARSEKRTKAKAEEKKSLQAKQQSVAKLPATKSLTEVKSRLPVPVRLRVLASSTPTVNLQPNEGCNQTAPHQRPDPVDSSGFSTNPDALYQQSRDDSPGISSVVTDHSSDTGEDQCRINPGSFSQLELLFQECQGKDSLIQELREQLGERENLQAQLQEKEQLNCRYAEELQAQKNTIAYLTACSLDSQNGLGSQPSASVSDGSLQSKCDDLHKALQDKEELIAQHLELLNIAKQALAALDSTGSRPEVRDFCLKVKTVLEQDDASSNNQNTRGNEDSIGGLQTALLEQNRLSTELQERLGTAHEPARHGGTGLCTSSRQTQTGSGEHIGGEVETDRNRLQQLNKVLTSCLDSAESAVTLLVDTSGPNPDLQQHLDQLQTCLKERQDLEKLGEPTLHQNLCVLCKRFSEKISELQVSLQEERICRAEGEARSTALEAKGLPPSVQLQLETLHKALREKKKACKSLEERLASAQSNMAEPSAPSHSAPALEQDDKSVQVDFQDLGYETSGKSENDREESSSTDLEVRVKPGCSNSSLPSLLKQEQVTFSSTENLDSSSSTPYPSSPALSSAKASLKSPQVYEDSGVSEDSARVMKAHQENKSGDLSPSRFHLAGSRNPDGTQREEVENQVARGQTSGTEQEKSPNRSFSEQLTRSRSTSPARSLWLHSSQSESSSTHGVFYRRLDSLVQSQARELSQLRQQIKESRRLGCLLRRQLPELSKAFQELLQASEVDRYMGEVVKGQLDKSMIILDRLEGRLDKGDSHADNQDRSALELSRSVVEPLRSAHSWSDLPDSSVRIQQEIDNLRVELEGDRELLQQHVAFLVRQNLTLAECAGEQLDLLAVELQEKNRLIQSLQSQVRSHSPSSHHSSHSDQCSDRTSSSSRSSPTAPGRHAPRRRHKDGGAESGDVQLQRENGRLQERLRSSVELNATLRCELDLHRSIMAQNRQQPGLDESQSGEADDAGNISAHASAPPQSVSPDLLAEHLQEIRALRQRLEESICTNDRLREQLEKRLAEVEKDSATNIFIHGSKEKLAGELRLLWQQNQSLKEQMHQVSRDKQREADKLRDTLTRRTSKLEQSRTELDALRQERQQLQERLEISSRENAQLRDSLHCSTEELSRLQVEVKLQQQQLTDSQRLLQSLRVELQVFEKMKGEAQRHREAGVAAPESVPAAGPVDLSELLSEIRRLRLQLERSIQTNTALRQKLEEQLLRGAGRSDTININYLLSPDEGGRSPGREGCDLNHVFTGHNHHHDDDDARGDEVQPVTRVSVPLTRSVVSADAESRSSFSSSSGEGLSDAPYRLVPGHRMWADRNGRHVLALIEDFNALRKQISEGRKVSRSMGAQLHTLEQQARRRSEASCRLPAVGLCGQRFSNSRSPQVLDQKPVKGFSSSVSSMQQVLGEASRLLKLVWRVSLPAAPSAGDGSNNNQQDQQLMEEISRLKSRLSQQEKMLSGAVKRLRTTNQLKEGMERVIIDQLSVTHGVLKKARGNLEEVPVNGQ